MPSALADALGDGVAFVLVAAPATPMAPSESAATSPTVMNPHFFLLLVMMISCLVVGTGWCGKDACASSDRLLRGVAAVGGAAGRGAHELRTRGASNASPVVCAGSGLRRGRLVGPTMRPVSWTVAKMARAVNSVMTSTAVTFLRVRFTGSPGFGRRALRGAPCGARRRVIHFQCSAKWTTSRAIVASAVNECTEIQRALGATARPSAPAITRDTMKPLSVTPTAETNRALSTTRLSRGV